MKIKIGKTVPSNRPHDYSFDNSTTFDWGVIQPTCKIAIDVPSKIISRVGSFVRLSPLVVPTFGRAILKHYAYFVPSRDIMPCYENMISGTSFSGSRTYVPRYEYQIPLKLLATFVLNSQCSVYHGYSATRVVDDEYELSPLPGESPNLLNDYLGLNSQNPMRAFTTLDHEESVNPNNCDFVIRVPTAVPNSSQVYCLKLKPQGKKMRNVLLGLGYQINWRSSRLVSLMPLLAFYKAYFDLFAIKRTVNWQSTTCYSFIMKANMSGDLSFPFNDTAVRMSFAQFYNSLLTGLYYSEPTNLFTAHQTTLNNQQVPLNIGTITSMEDVNLYHSSSVDSTSDGTTISTPLYPVLQRLANRVLPFVNKYTAFGASIRDYFRAMGFGQVDDDKESGFVGATSVNIDFSDVMSTAETAEASIGEYRGKGVGGNSGETFKYDAKCPGYFIVLSTIVPRAGFCQGVDASLFRTNRFGKFTPDFDSLGYEITPKESFFSASDVDNGYVDPLGTEFGVIPRYAMLKGHPLNILNGDMSLRSTRLSMLPYTLDRWFEFNSMEYDSTSGIITFKDNSVPYVNDTYRFIGQSDFLGNFDRIFQYYGEGINQEDHFIAHMMFDIKVINSMKPISESFTTDEDVNGFVVEKA